MSADYTRQRQEQQEGAENCLAKTEVSRPLFPSPAAVVCNQWMLCVSPKSENLPPSESQNGPHGNRNERGDQAYPPPRALFNVVGSEIDWCRRCTVVRQCRSKV